MWIDDQGVAHTVALPNPASLMADDFRTSLDALVASHRSEVEHLLESVEADLAETGTSSLVGLDQEGRFEGVAPPEELLQGSLSSVQDLSYALEQVNVRWRLDAVLVLGDYID